MASRVILHLDGQDQNHEVKNLRAVNPRCTSCNALIDRDRLRWFAKRGMKPSECSLCAFEKRVGRSQPQP